MGEERIALKRLLHDMAEEGLIDGKKTVFVAIMRAGSGFLEDQFDGWRLSLTLMDGVLAVPFQNRLAVRIERDDKPRPDVPVAFEFDGASVTSTPADPPAALTVMAAFVTLRTETRA